MFSKRLSSCSWKSGGGGCSGQVVHIPRVSGQVVPGLGVVSSGGSRHSLSGWVRRSRSRSSQLRSMKSSIVREVGLGGPGPGVVSSGGSSHPFYGRLGQVVHGPVGLAQVVRGLVGVRSCSPWSRGREQVRVRWSMVGGVCGP